MDRGFDESGKQCAQAARNVLPDEMLSSKALKEEREGAQGDPRKEGSRMKAQDVQRPWALECGRACAENQSKQKLVKCRGREGRSPWSLMPLSREKPERSAHQVSD